MATAVVMALSWLCCVSMQAQAGTQETSAQTSDSLTVSLITCYPGPEVYELAGHEAIRIRDGRHDTVWNFGIFDFEQPNFVYRFVKGQTDYKVAAYPFRYFLPEYIERGSRVVEQELNLTQEEAQLLLLNLLDNTREGNSTYRYNYVKDNCATRLVDHLDRAVPSRIIYPDTIAYGTFRKEMRAWHEGYPWYQFGIDMALGSGLDYQLRGREEMFVPVVLMQRAAKAHIGDGRPLVRETRILNEGVADATLPPTPWWLSPLFVFWFVCGLTAALCVWSVCGGPRLRWLYTLWFGVIGLVGCLSVFLVFISEHEATSPNLLTLWLNPLQLVMAICVWWRRTRYATAAVAWYDIAVIGCLLVIWPMQRQSANPAMFPVMLTTLILSATYAINFIKRSYNINMRVPSGLQKKPVAPRARKKK